jgi:integrase
MRVVDALSAEPLAPGGRFVWDDEIKGLGLRLWVAGGTLARRWIFRYRLRRERRYRFLTIGEYGQPWTIEMAQDEARRLQGEVASNRDPAREREATKAVPTLEAAITSWIKKHGEKNKAEDSVRGDKFLAARRGLAFVDVAPNGRTLSKLGRSRLDDISRDQIEALHLSLIKTPYEANRTLALLSSVFRFHGRSGKDNPCQGVERCLEEKREQILTDEELIRLRETIDAVMRDGSESPIAIAAIVLGLVTGARPKELRTARREWVDLERGTLRIPQYVRRKDGRLRGGTKEKKAKTIRLGPHALAVIRSIPVYRNNPYLFPGRRRGQHLVNLHDAWDRIRKQAGLKHVRFYDLRHNFASVLARDFNQSLPKIGALLGHSSSQTTERYVHLLPDQLREIADAAGEKLAGLLKKENA